MVRAFSAATPRIGVPRHHDRAVAVLAFWQLELQVHPLHRHLAEQSRRIAIARTVEISLLSFYDLATAFLNEPAGSRPPVPAALGQCHPVQAQAPVGPRPAAARPRSAHLPRRPAHRAQARRPPFARAWGPTRPLRPQVVPLLSRRPARQALREVFIHTRINLRSANVAVMP